MHYTIIGAGIFVFTAVAFMTYSAVVEKRQRLVLSNALRSGAIVSSLFPESIARKLMEEKKEESEFQSSTRSAYLSNNRKLKSFLSGDDELGSNGALPLAELYPATTVMFADIANFTSWASARDPSQVFLLLQTVYQAFDAVANSLKVFKVETVGDSYVAVAGLPEAQPTHALIMCRFAQACLTKFVTVTKRLEVTLGPDTGELKMRFGLHSGPCTAGVLRGERARFQLFGDTVNMASRMESRRPTSGCQASPSQGRIDPVQCAIDPFKSHGTDDVTRVDELEDEISMPLFDVRVADVESDPSSIRLRAEVTSQLRTYIYEISNMYQENPFHNFSHASHVAMSVDKLLKRIATPDIQLEIDDGDAQAVQRKAVMMGLHDYTHGITSDPLTQFAVVLSALIHDVDHRGVSNGQLALENPTMAGKYRSQSVAEQNSIDVAWDLLMEDRFEDLRSRIFTNKDEPKRFRQTIVNVVLATDIFDKELNDQRKQRWKIAFAEPTEAQCSKTTTNNTTATSRQRLSSST